MGQDPRPPQLQPARQSPFKGRIGPSGTVHAAGPSKPHTYCGTRALNPDLDDMPLTQPSNRLFPEPTAMRTLICTFPSSQPSARDGLARRLGKAHRFSLFCTHPCVLPIASRNPPCSNDLFRHGSCALPSRSSRCHRPPCSVSYVNKSASTGAGVANVPLACWVWTLASFARAVVVFRTPIKRVLTWDCICHATSPRPCTSSACFVCCDRAGRPTPTHRSAQHAPMACLLAEMQRPGARSLQKPWLASSCRASLSGR